MEAAASGAPAPPTNAILVETDTRVDTPSPMLPDNQEGVETPKPIPPFAPVTPQMFGRTPTTPYHGSPPSLRPKPGQLHLSETAIEQRARRLLTPKANGQQKLSADVIALYRAGGKSRQEFFAMFQACGFDPDWFNEEIVNEKQKAALLKNRTYRNMRSIATCFPAIPA